MTGDEPNERSKRMSEAAMNGASAVNVPDHVIEGTEREMLEMSPERRKTALAELEAMMTVARAAAAKADAADGVVMATDVPAAPAVAQPPATEAAVDAKPPAPASPTPALAADPYPDPPHMVGSQEIAYLWSQEAIEKSAYLVSVDEWKKAHPTFSIDDFAYLMVGDKIKRFRPLDGLLLEAEGGGDTGVPMIFKFLLQQPLIVAAASGKLVEPKLPTKVVAHPCHSLHKLMPLLQFPGCCHVGIRPTGWQTTLSGEREWSFQILVEPDETNGDRPKLITLESALGKAAR